MYSAMSMFDIDIKKLGNRYIDYGSGWTDEPMGDGIGKARGWLPFHWAASCIAHLLFWWYFASDVGFMALSIR